MGVRVYKARQHDFAAAIEFFGLQLFGLLGDLSPGACRRNLPRNAEHRAILDDGQLAQFTPATRAGATALREQLSDIGEKQGLRQFDLHHGDTEALRKAN